MCPRSLGAGRWVHPGESPGLLLTHGAVRVFARVCVCRAISLVPAVCVRQRVPRLIYTSTVSVAFGGQPIEQGDEDSVPYFPLEKVGGFWDR